MRKPALAHLVEMGRL
jgi:hypothetical protein